jgi:hypothetical protein
MARDGPHGDDLDRTVLLGTRKPDPSDVPTLVLADKAARKPTERPSRTKPRWSVPRGWPRFDLHGASPRLMLVGGFVAGVAAVVAGLLIVQPWSRDAQAPVEVVGRPAPVAPQAVAPPVEPQAVEPLVEPKREDDAAPRTALAVPKVAEPQGQERLAPADELARSIGPVALLPRQEGPAPTRPASYREILANNTRTLRWFRYAGNDRIMILDYPSLREQGRALNRIATLVEKSGTPRDRIMSSTELRSYIDSVGRSSETLYFGHDYRAADIARFFNLADRDATPLSAEEHTLRRILLEQGVLIQANGQYQAAMPEQALVSLVQQQADDPATAQSELVTVRLRHIILRHELSHGEFFTNQSYREYCERFWRDRLSEAQRAAFRKFLATRDYDPDNERLMINEMQAFLGHTPDKTIFNAESLGIAPQELEQLRRRFLVAAPRLSLFEEGVATLTATGDDRSGAPAADDR